MANELDYTQFDFDELVQQLQDRLRATDAWKDTVESATGQMLIELLAYVGNMVLFYVERRAEESYIDTAQNKSSVVNLVSLVNYVPKRVTSSTGILTFYLDAVHALNISLPRWTECQTAAGIKFVTLESVTIIAGNTEVESNAVQGEIASQSATSDGSASQEYLINDTTIEDSADEDNRTLIVTVGGITWTPVSSFINSTNTSTHYRILGNLDDTVTIQFGDDIKGKSPTTGSAIIIQYVKSDGISGNVYSNNSITTLNDTITDSEAAVVSDINVKNENTLFPNDPNKSRKFLGGDAAEDIEEIRFEAPRVFSTGDRAVTKNDFIAIIENIAGVASVNVWGENEEAEAAGEDADVTMLNLVRLSIILQEWTLPDDTFKDTLSEDIRAVSMIPVKYEYVDPDIINIITYLDVIAVKGASLTEVQDTIETTLENQLLLGTTTKIGTDIFYSNLVQSIDALNDVKHIDMTVKVRKDLSETYSSADFGALLNADPIQTETVEVYVGTEQIAIDDGVGGFTDLSSDFTVTGTVDYITGEVEIDIDESTGSEDVYVIYQQDENGNTITEFNEIVKLYSVIFNSLAIEA